MGEDLKARLLGQAEVSSTVFDKVCTTATQSDQAYELLLVQLGYLKESQLAQVLSDFTETKVLSRANLPSTADLFRDIPFEFFEQNLVVPCALSGDKSAFVAALPHRNNLDNALRLAMGHEVVIYTGVLSEVLMMLEGYQSLLDGLNNAGGDEGLGGELLDEAHLMDMANGAPIIRVVNQLFTKAVTLKASDIHIEPVDNQLKVRFRVDGHLQPFEQLKSISSTAVVSRIKILAHLDIAEHRQPQDGRIKVVVEGHSLDMRVSTIPTLQGETVVIRLLDQSSLVLDFDSLGFRQEQAEIFRGLLAKPHGIVLVTGPTGSGKTTTLYTALEYLNEPSRKIITVENPVEYQLQGVQQVQVDFNIDLSFAKVLRSTLRQDPDIMMIGEMRDGETAEIAVQAALTGHVVLSTLHTNDAPSAITRMVNMGVEPFLVASTCNAVLAQRLVRKLCPSCKEAYQPEAELLAACDFEDIDSAMFYRSVGCEACNHSGYLGRTVVLELMLITPEIQQLIFDGASEQQIRDKAIAGGMVPMATQAFSLVEQGISSYEEAAALITAV